MGTSSEDPAKINNNILNIIIWIDQKITNDENAGYLKELKRKLLRH